MFYLVVGGVFILIFFTAGIASPLLWRQPKPLPNRQKIKLSASEARTRHDFR